METPSPRRERATSLWGQVLCGTLTTLGILGLLRGGLSGFSEAPQEVVIFDLHPVAGVVHLVLGLVGTYLVSRSEPRRRFLSTVGALLVLWAALTAVAGGSPRELLADDGSLVVLYLAGGLVSLAVVHLPTRAGRPEATEP